MATAQQDHWLARPRTIGLLSIGFAMALAGLLLADLVVEHHALFGIDGIFEFAAWYGFGSCAALVVFAKALGALLKRPDAYYDD